MANSLGEAVLDLSADPTQLDKDINAARGNVLNVLNGLSRAGGMILGAGLAIAGAGILAIGKGLYESVQAAAEAEQVQAQLNSVLESTGGIAGVTSDQVNSLADNLSNLTMFDDEAIVSAESLLLTFTNIGKDVFPTATETILDMSQALGQDLQSTTTQVGKALQDPILGITALKKAGVNFTEDQKKLIKTLVQTGKLEEAQAIILDELAIEYGGAAEAAGKTFAGQLKILQTKLGNIQETVGVALMPVLMDLATMFSETLNKPETIAFIENLAKAIGDFAADAAAKLPAFIEGFKDGFEWLQDNQGVIVGVLAALGAAVAVFLYTTLAPLLPILAAMALIGAAAYVLYQAWTQNWGGIQDHMAAVWAWLQPILQTVWTWLQVNIPLALQAVANYWTTVLLPAIQAFWAWLQPMLQQLWTWLSINIPLAMQTLTNYWTLVLLPAIMAVWMWLTTVLFPFFQALAAFIVEVFSLAVTVLAGVWQNVLAPALEEVWKWFSEKILPVLETLIDMFAENLMPTITEVAGWLKNKLVVALDGVTDALKDMSNWLTTIVEKLQNIKKNLPSWMTPGSPTPWEIGLLGVNDALKKLSNASLPNLSASMGAMPAPALASDASTGMGGGKQYNFYMQSSDLNEDQLMRALNRAETLYG